MLPVNSLCYIVKNKKDNNEKILNISTIRSFVIWNLKNRIIETIPPVFSKLRGFIETKYTGSNSQLSVLKKVK